MMSEAISKGLAIKNLMSFRYADSGDGFCVSRTGFADTQDRFPVFRSVTARTVLVVRPNPGLTTRSGPRLHAISA